jgi:hypothetical protein
VTDQKILLTFTMQRHGLQTVSAGLAFEAVKQHCVKKCNKRDPKSCYFILMRVKNFFSSRGVDVKPNTSTGSTYYYQGMYPTILG